MSTKNVGSERVSIIEKFKKRLPEWALLPLIAVIGGLIAGTAAGGFYVRTMVFNRVLPVAVFRPAADLVHSYRLINSADPLERLAGYYTASDRGAEGSGYLAVRYPDEDKLAVKRAIIYIMGSPAGDTEAAIKFYAGIYGSADSTIRADIIASVRRMGSDSLSRFAERAGIQIAPEIKKEYIELRILF